MNKKINDIFKNYAFLTTATLALITLSFSIKADTIDPQGTRWPIPDWNVSINKMATKQCRDFIKFSTKSKNFLTDGLIIVKDGEVKYEDYDEKYTAKTPHALWSVSKTITGALLGLAVDSGRISLDQKLNEFYPRFMASENYQKIKITNLFYLDTGFIWNEFYSGDVKKNPVINMLYGEGRNDIVKFATSYNITNKGPGYKWGYTTGTPAITMGVLKSIYGDNYDNMPWDSLFNPLGMNNVTFERDHLGIFNGGSSVFANPRDMAKIGYLYLNKGKWNGTEILSEEWIEKTLTISPGYLSEGTVINDITDDGVYGGSIWLNRSVKKGFGKPYPTSPNDMFLALGHFGQMIIVLPTQKMIIVRTGHDQEYNSKVDEFVTRALSCFDDPNFPIGKNIPPPSNTKTTLGKILKTLKSGLETNIIQASVAKNICSCHFISGIDINTCLERSNIPMAKLLSKVSIDHNIVRVKQSQLAQKINKISDHASSKIEEARFDQDHPEFGCSLK